MTRVRVSDHAVLKWLERVEGVDVAAIRRRITGVAQTAAAARAVGVRLQGVGFCLQYNGDEAVVTTTLSVHTRPHLSEPRLPIAEADAD